MSRKPLIAGNWKMHKTREEAEALARGICEQVEHIGDMDIVLGPPAVYLDLLGDITESSHVDVSAQTMHWADEGAYTGELAPRMIDGIGCDYVILGHSERRSYFGVTDEDVNAKLHAALFQNLTPMVCVGETLEERNTDRVERKIKFQIEAAFSGVEATDAKKAVVAYEPLWAIGTGESATPEQAGRVHELIRDILTTQYGREIAEQVQIVYGGSVKPHNVESLYSETDIDGALVGGASLAVDSFAAIAKKVDAMRG